MQLFHYLTKNPYGLFIMKISLTAIIFTASLSGLFAFSSNAQTLKESKIDTKEQRLTLEAFFKYVEDKTPYEFIYAPQEFNLNQKVNLKAGEYDLHSLLESISEEHRLRFEKIKYSVIVTKSRANENPTVQEVKAKTIEGKVSDQNGLPLPGANIKVPGTSIGTTADANGAFVFDIPDTTKFIEVSYIGYITRKISVENKSRVEITLSEDNQSLDEVVVIGYGQQERAKVVGAVGAISSSELENVAASSFEQQLAGKMSGVVINQPNGQPGAASQIVIRGTGTLTAGTNPLIVVDGYPLTEGSSINSINPNDIEDINVLKDAASAAIYGSRAANGVILVTTKHGGKNKKTSFSLDVYTGLQQESSGVELVDAYDHALYLQEARNWGYVSKDPTVRSENDPNSVRVTRTINGQGIDGRELNLDFLQPYIDGTPGLTNTNWLDEAFNTARISNYLFSAQGGNEKTSYYTSLGYFDQEGVVRGTDFQRYSAALNLETELNDRIKLGVNIKPSYSIQNAADQGSRSWGALALSLLSFPYYEAYNPDGSVNISDQLVNEQREIEGVRINGTPVENLVATAEGVKNQTKRLRGFGNVFLNANILDGLDYRISLGGDYVSSQRDYYYPASVGEYRVPAPRTDANAEQTLQDKINFLVENTLTYRKSFGQHNFNVLLGHTFQKENINNTFVEGTGFADDNIENIAGASSFTASSSHEIWALESYLARIQYDFASKYLLSAAIRRDGSSRFGVNNRWGNFPSLSAGWIFSREDFFPMNDVLTFGKLSASWGQTGNNQIGNYSSKALVTDDTYIFGSAIQPGYITSSAPNPDLGWEVASSFNVGFDLSFFNGKVDLSTAYYKTNTRDLLLDVPVPQQTGYTNVLANIGEMENQGFEVQIAANQFNIGNVNIGVNANLTTYNNKVLALGPGQERIATGRDQLFITQIGRPIAEIYGYKITGIYKTQEEIDATPHLDGTLTGDYIVEDVNRDGSIDTDDLISKGTYAPDFTYGFGAHASYKGFTFSFNFTGVEGRTLMDGDMASITESGEGFGVPSTYYFENRYHPVNNPNGFLGQPNFGNFSNSRKILRSSIVVDEGNGDYLRLRDVRLAYNFPKKWLKSIHLSDLQIYLSGNNLFTVSDWRSWNNDATSGDILTSGYSSGSNYPVAKTYLIGFKITPF